MNLNGLNEKQKSAASIINGPLLILAGAGSGKTRTITYRMAHMIRNHKIDSSSMLALTFTNKAAKEMKERIRKLVGRAAAPQTITFHALGLTILKKEIELLGMRKNFTLYDRSDQQSLLRQALKTLKNGKSFDKQTLLSMMGDLKNKNIAPHEYANSLEFDESNDYCLALEYCYPYITEKMKYFNAIDFDDILLLTNKIFQNHPEVAKRYSSLYKYITVDEYQDTNPIQFNILKALTSVHHNICVVGDDDQSIYKFRGADIENILRFESHYPGANVVKLEENYRSTPNILALSNNIIKDNKHRKEKALWTSKPNDDLPLLWETLDTNHEAQIVVEQIEKLRTQGISPKEIAVLYRSNTQVPPFEDQLRLNQVPYKILGGKKLYERKEVKDLIAYFSVIFNPFDEISVRRVLNVPNRGIGAKTLEKYLNISTQSKKNLFRSLKEHCLLENDMKVSKFIELIQSFRVHASNSSLREFIQNIIDSTGYIKYLSKMYDSQKQIEVRKNILFTFLESASRFESRYQGDNLHKDFLEKILLTDSQDEKEEEEKNEVTLMTMHSSKGLEFDYVFIIGMEEELLPHKRTIVNGEDIEEERRLCYVGITRARKQVYMTYCKQRMIYNKNSPRHLSRFLLGKEQFYTHQDRTTFGHMTKEEAQEYKSNFFQGLMSSLD